jgi:serine/threonine protein kinase
VPQKEREDGHGDDNSSEEEEEMELSNLGSSDQSSVQIRTIGSIVRWQRGNMIGAGSYGKVYMGMNSDTGELFVIKQVVFHAQGVGGVPNEGKSGNEEDVLQLEQEIALLATLQHEHIVQYFGTERNYVTNELSIFLEHMPGGSIADIVLKFGPLQEAVVKKYTREVLQGLKYLHGKGIIHRDIKGQNILVDNKGVCKLADFGASRYLQTADSAANMSFKGTPVFMSPEVIMEQRYSRKSDIWSVGCTVVQMATGNPPFSEFSNHIAALFHITSTTEPPPVPANISAEAQDFVLKCFERDLSKRPFVDALLRHSFIEKGAPGSGSPLNAITTPGTPSPASPTFRAQRACNNVVPLLLLPCICFLPSADPFNRQCEHLYRQCEHLYRQCEHLYRQCEHLYRQCEHLYRQCEHLYAMFAIGQKARQHTRWATLFWRARRAFCSLCF